MEENLKIKIVTAVIKPNQHFVSNERDLKTWKGDKRHETKTVSLEIHGLLLSNTIIKISFIIKD